MTKEYLPKLFEAYSQENRNSASQVVGTGLGLSIVKQLVNILHGRIEVESAPGKGTTFTVTFALPQVMGYVPPDEPEKEGSTQAQLAGKRVLLCEDQFINAELARAVLEEWDMQVTWAKNGQEGLHYFQKEPSGTYAFILMDKQMPILGGIAAVKELRRLPQWDAAKVPIVALTGDADEVSGRECLEAGMNAVVTKPLKREYLRKALLDLLKKTKG